MSKLPDLSTLFDYYCEVYISSDLEIAELIEKYPMEKTIRSYKKEAFAFLKNDMPQKKKTGMDTYSLYGMQVERIRTPAGLTPGKLQNDPQNHRKDYPG